MGRDEYELREVTREEFMTLFRPSAWARLRKRLVAARCRVLGHRWDSTDVDHGPGLHERLVWCSRCWARPEVDQ